MKKLLFFFLDGVGLGNDDPEINPFSASTMPILQGLLGGKKLILETVPLETSRATLLALDANLGVAGLPQSATGQATLINGKNVPAEIGNHYGPKPNQAVAKIVSENNLFKRLKQNGLNVSFLNAFPPSYFEAIGSGKRLYGTIALAAARAGVPLRTIDDLRQGRALSADFTGVGMRERLKLKDIPIITPEDAGRRLSRLSEESSFSLFEYWLSDYAGHGQDMKAALELLGTFDRVMDGLIECWHDEEGLIVLTSDHGNLEDLSTRRHTDNPVPALIIGGSELRREFSKDLKDLTGIYPAIMSFFA